MSRSQLSLAVLLVVASVVALEEWRMVGLRKDVAKAEQERDEARAALPPPPRPVGKGDANSVVGASKIRRMKDLNGDRMDGGVEPAVAVVDSTAGVEPAEPVVTVMNELPIEELDYRESVSQMYAALINSYQFNETERNYFIGLLADGMKFQEILARARETASSDEARAAAEAKMAQAEQDFGAKIHHFLGNDRDYQVYQAYVAKLAEQLGGH